MGRGVGRTGRGSNRGAASAHNSCCRGGPKHHTRTYAIALATCRPAGKLKVCIKATWLRNARVDADAMTEVTGASFYADSHYDDDEEGGGEEGYGEEGGRLAEEEQVSSGRGLGCWTGWGLEAGKAVVCGG